MEISAAYESALLAQMAYAKNLNNSKSGNDLVNALINEVKGAENVTRSQAEYFASKYVVVRQTENIETGFSATLFQNIDTGEYHLATRGSAGFSFTEPDWIDANADNFSYGIAYDQVVDLINFYLRLTAPINDKNTNNAAQQFKFEEQTVEVDSASPEGGIFWGHEYDEGIDSDGDGVDDIIGDIYLIFKPIALSTS